MSEPLSFEWDTGNTSKNFEKHLVTNQEAEEVFINQPLVVIADIKHSMTERRFQALGKTNNNRPLFLSFTIRNNKVRIISIRKVIPKFQSEVEERDFWLNHDSTEYVDWSKADVTVFPNLKPTTESISLRLPSYLLVRIKQLANKKDVPYQSLMKVFLSEKVDQEFKTK